MAEQRDLFYDLAEPALEIARAYLGEGYEKVLIDGYYTFVVDVNRSQQAYEKDGHYLHSSFQEVYESAYGDDDFMRLYHWGVFTTTFAWRHHLRIYGMFRDKFLSRLDPASEGTLIDLGSGSGIWHLLAHRKVPGWSMTAVDISPLSVQTSREMIGNWDPAAKIEYVCDDATKHKLKSPADAGVCCFLLEHLESPPSLLKNLSDNLKEGGYAFVTGALTAAEHDHIYEYVRESELLLHAEEAGLRVISAESFDSGRTPRSQKYLPRSMAMLMQKRTNDIW